MTAWQGVALAIAAACAHTGIDSLRKHGSQKIPSDQLVALVGVLDALLSCSFVAGFGLDSMVNISNLWKFVAAVSGSSLFLLLTKVLYQRALHSAPLSLTIPFLSFSPAMLLFTAYVILGEKPSETGLLGVFIVTAGGYCLALRHSPLAPGALAKKEEDLLQGPGSGDQLHVLEIKLYSSNGSSEARDAGTAGAAAGGPDSLTIKAQRWQLRRLRRLRQLLASALRPLAALQTEPACVSMLIVAALSSVTASLDKLGVLSAASISIYFAAQRALIGLACLGYLLQPQHRQAFSHFTSSGALLLSISALELAAVVLFLKALDYLFVSYVVAVKRCNILFSVLAGGLLFKESIVGRLPYVLAMVLGMVLIVAEPGSHRLHSHVNTHH